MQMEEEVEKQEIRARGHRDNVNPLRCLGTQLVAGARRTVRLGDTMMRSPQLTGCRDAGMPLESSF